MDHNGKEYDTIIITDLLLRCIIGINPEEREKKQDVIINIAIYADLSAAGISDSIDETVNYKSIKNAVVQMVESSSFFLIEKMAESIAQICLEHSIVQAARVKVDKPGALRFAKSVAVEIYRQR